PHLKYREPESVAAAAKKAPEPVGFAQTQAIPSAARPMVVSRPAPRPELSKESPALVTDAAPLAPISRNETRANPMVPAANADSQEPQVNALDLFDPVVFNRQMHPGK